MFEERASRSTLSKGLSIEGKTRPDWACYSDCKVIGSDRIWLMCGEQTGREKLKFSLRDV